MKNLIEKYQLQSSSSAFLIFYDLEANTQFEMVFIL